jgi:hypothetical protein
VYLPTTHDENDDEEEKEKAHEPPEPGFTTDRKMSDFFMDVIPFRRQ